MGYLLLFSYSLWLLWIYYQDGRQRPAVSGGIWVVLIWGLIHGTRPVTDWLGQLGLSSIQGASRDEGNPVEASINLCLIIVGLIILIRRKTSLILFMKDNPWVALLYAFWCMSVLWSDAPLITVKRLIMGLGCFIMVLVVLTEKAPMEAIKAVSMRLVYATIPLSIILFRYFPQLGRALVGYYEDTPMVVGVSTHKNLLGILAAVAAIFLVWEFLDGRNKIKTARLCILGSRILMFIMAWYLLLITNSVTSLLCALFGTIALLVFSQFSGEIRLGKFELWGITAVTLLVLLNQFYDVRGVLLDSVGRDATLTTRTNVWPILIEHQNSPLVGEGFNTFWSGQRLVNLADEVGGIIQAHNGYLETYLNGGYVGLSLLGIVLLSSYLRIRRRVMCGEKDSRIKYVLLLFAIIHNVSEATFFKVGILWFLTIFALIEYQPQVIHRSATPSVEGLLRNRSL